MLLISFERSATSFVDFLFFSFFITRAIISDTAVDYLFVCEFIFIVVNFDALG